MSENSHPFTTPVSPLSFFVLTFILSWLIWIPLVMSHFNLGPVHIPEETSGLIRLFGVLMPATAAMILTALAGGHKALKSLLSRLFIWRVPLRWWAAAVLVQPVLLGVAALIYNVTSGGADLEFEPITSISAMVVNVIFLLIATLGEEIGWRGVALPGLQQRRRPLQASILLGLLWGAWHLPFWLLMDTYDQFGVGYLVLNFLLFPITLYITWFFNHTAFSLLLVVMFHLAFNIVNTALLPVTTSITAFAILIVFEWILAIVVTPRLDSDLTRTLRAQEM